MKTLKLIASLVTIVIAVFLFSCTKDENTPVIPPPPPPPSYSYHMLDSLYNISECLLYNSSDYVFLNGEGDTLTGLNSGCEFMVTPPPATFKSTVNGLYQGNQFYTDTTRIMRFVMLAAAKVGPANILYKYYRMERYTEGAALFIDGAQVVADYPNPHPKIWGENLIMKFYDDDSNPVAELYGLYESSNGNITFYYP